MTLAAEVDRQGNYGGTLLNQFDDALAAEYASLKSGGGTRLHDFGIRGG